MLEYENQHRHMASMLDTSVITDKEYNMVSKTNNSAGKAGTAGTYTQHGFIPVVQGYQSQSGHYVTKYMPVKADHTLRNAIIISIVILVVLVVVAAIVL